MPTREGKKSRNRRTREETRRQLQSEDKNTTSNARSDDGLDQSGRFMEDYHHSSDLDDACSSDMIDTDEEDNRTLYTNIPPQPHFYESIEEQALDSRELPAEIFTILSNFRPTTKIIEILKRVEDEEERYRSPKDEHGHRVKRTKINSFPREPIVQHFRDVRFMDFEQEDGKQILDYVQTPILKKSSYGVLLYNSKKEILAVESHRGSWSAPKGHRKIKHNDQLETIKETATCKFNKEIRTTNRMTNEVYNYYDIDREYHLDWSKYLECRLDDIRRGDKARCIGLFLIKIDESQLAFNLPDTYENRNCKWFALDDILTSQPKTNFDKFYTLRPFVEQLNKTVSCSDTQGRSEEGACGVTLSTPASRN